MYVRVLLVLVVYVLDFEVSQRFFVIYKFVFNGV